MLRLVTVCNRVRTDKLTFDYEKSDNKIFHFVRSDKKNFYRVRSGDRLIRSDKKMHPLQAISKMVLSEICQILHDKNSENTGDVSRS